MFWFILCVIALVVGLIMTSMRGQRLEGVGVLGIGVVLLLASTLAIVPSGHVGVLTVFGKVQENIIHEGMHFIAPWADAHMMSIREQEFTKSMNASSSSGVTVDLVVSIIYQLDPEYASHIYRSVGSDYVDILITPFINRNFKDLLVEYDAEALYTYMRGPVNIEIEALLTEFMAPKGITIIGAPIENMDLPTQLRNAIVEREEAEQEALAMEYRILQETLEADRKRIEAAGIRDFQAIVSEGISEPLLYWKYIETLGELSDNENNTFLMISTDIMGALPFAR